MRYKLSHKNRVSKQHIALGAIVTGAVITLLTASCAYADIWPFSKAKKDPTAQTQTSQAQPTQAPNTAANSPTAYTGEDWRDPTPSERAAAMRSDPLIKATFFSRLFEHNPHDEASGVILSDALRALGRNSEAADIAHRVLLFKPDNLDAMMAASRAHIADNNAFYSIDLLKIVAEKRPQDWRVWSLLGVAYEQVKRFDDAHTAWSQALILSPNNPSVLTNQAMALSANGRFAEAEPLLRKAVSQGEATAQMRQNLALVLGLQGKMSEAETLMRQDLPPEVVEQNLNWFTSQSSNQAQAMPASTVRGWNSLRPNQ